MRGGASTYCYPHVQLGNGTFIQYETISEGAFCYDLNNWSELHVSGHLHKPIETIVAANSREIAISIENNIQHALRVSLLLLPEEFSYENLFMEIAMCTYDGKQFRMNRTKNREKIGEMVKTKLEEYFQLYLPNLKQHFSHCVRLPDPNKLSDGKIKQDKSADMNRKHFHELPSAILCELGGSNSEDVPKNLINLYVEDQEMLQTSLKAALLHTVGRTHQGQQTKDYVTVTLPNKITKMFSSYAR